MNVLDEVREMRDVMRQSGWKPARLEVGRGFAIRLYDEVSKTVPTFGALPDFLRGIEAGEVVIYGMRIEAGWEMRRHG